MTTKAILPNTGAWEYSFRDKFEDALLAFCLVTAATVRIAYGKNLPHLWIVIIVFIGVASLMVGSILLRRFLATQPMFTFRLSWERVGVATLSSFFMFSAFVRLDFHHEWDLPAKLVILVFCARLFWESFEVKRKR